MNSLLRFFKPSALNSDTPGSQFGNDLREGLRNAGRDFLRKPLFPIAAILSLAIGVGLNTTLFTEFNGVVLNPIPVKDSSGLFEIEGVDEKGRKSETYSFREYVDLRDKNQAFQQAAADYATGLNTPDGPLRSFLVSGNYFDTIGIQLLLGRAIQPDDDQPSSPPVVVLGHRVWQSRFGGDSQIVGRQIELANRSFTVIGVTANDVEGLAPSPTDLWVPLSTRSLFTGTSYTADKSDRWLRIIGRLKPGMTSEQARASLDTILPEVTGSRPQSFIQSHVILESFATYSSWQDFPWLLMSPIIFVFWLVLLIACSSIAMVQVARILSRRREIGERLAQGVSRPSIVRQLVIESFPLIVAGGALGLVLSHGFMVFLRKVIFAPETAASQIFAVTLDFKIFSYALFLSLIAGVIVGLFPALRATRLIVISNQKGDGGALGRKMRKGRLHHGLVIAQCALVLLLLGLAGSLIRHQLKLTSTPLGIDTSQGLFLELKNGTTRQEFHRKLAEVPGVVSVSNQMVEPLYDDYNPISVTFNAQDSRRMRTGFNIVSPEYFETLGVPLVRGRVFTSQEASSKADVAIVSQGAAQRFWPDQDPIGQQLTLNLKSPRIVQVVGVVGGVINKLPVEGQDTNLVYVPLNPAEPSNRFLARVEGDLGGMQRTIRAAISAAYPIADFDMYTLEDWMGWASYNYKVSSWVGAAIGIFCLLMAFMGTYGVMAQLANQRESEIATRPEEKQKISRAVFGEGWRLIIISVVSGLMVTLGIWYLLPEPVLRSHLIDPLVLIIAAGSLVTVVLLAALLAARKAFPGDPSVTRRREQMQSGHSELAFKLGAGGKD